MLSPGGPALVVVRWWTALVVGCWLVHAHDTGRAHKHHGQESAEFWANEWIIKVLSRDLADGLAEERGCINLGEVPGFDYYFYFRCLDFPEVGQEEAEATRELDRDLRVHWAEQQFEKVRVKRDVRRGIPPELLALWEEEEALDHPEKKVESNRVFNDVLWDHQWYLHDTRERSNIPDISLHVESVWRSGLSGKGVRVVVLDDGIDYTHPDLSPNYDKSISYDFNSDDDDPAPRNKVNSHGTRCAGEIAMVADNGLCGVGVAPNASIGGIRMLDGKISDRLEGLTLTYALDKVDIFSASWGPNDDGKTVEGPGRLAMHALEKGVKEGRGGKGIIYVWASGNGGSKGDDCNCDGYSSSIYTLSVSSASQQGAATWYGESCPSTLTSAYSSGAYTDEKVATTDVGGDCTVAHTGTSAAAPLAAGIVALVLEAAPGLTWRDVQYITAITSDPRPLKDNQGWRWNAAGLQYNPRFGFGVMDADRMVDVAKRWETLPEQVTCKVGMGDKVVSGNEVLISLDASNCEINYLEHAEAVVSIEHPRRGALGVVLVSRGGTETRLLAPREKDRSPVGFNDWPLVSVATWGEGTRGVWRVRVEDVDSHHFQGNVKDCHLLLHGTTKLSKKDFNIIKENRNKS